MSIYHEINNCVVSLAYKRKIGIDLTEFKLFGMGFFVDKYLITTSLLNLSEEPSKVDENIYVQVRKKEGGEDDYIPISSWNNYTNENNTIKFCLNTIDSTIYDYTIIPISQGVTPKIIQDETIGVARQIIAVQRLHGVSILRRGIISGFLNNDNYLVELNAINKGCPVFVLDVCNYSTVKKFSNFSEVTQGTICNLYLLGIVSEDKGENFYEVIPFSVIADAFNKKEPKKEDINDSRKPN